MEDITNLKITDVEVWNEDDKNIGLRLSWSANIGWGQYTIGFYDGRWYVDSEAMEVSPKLVINNPTKNFYDFKTESYFLSEGKVDHCYSNLFYVNQNVFGLKLIK